MAPKGWTTVKLRASTRKRLDRLRSVMSKPSDDEHKPVEREQVIAEAQTSQTSQLTNLSYDGIVNLLIDEYYYRRLL